MTPCVAASPSLDANPNGCMGGPMRYARCYAMASVEHRLTGSSAVRRQRSTLIEPPGVSISWQWSIIRCVVARRLFLLSDSTLDVGNVCDGIPGAEDA